jgi:hypothetical protein
MEEEAKVLAPDSPIIFDEEEDVNRNTPPLNRKRKPQPPPTPHKPTPYPSSQEKKDKLEDDRDEMVLSFIFHLRYLLYYLIY